MFLLFEFLQMDGQNGKPMYIQLYEGIKQGIELSNLRQGERMPSIRTAAKELNISRTTIENAYIKLCIEGYIESRPQRGYFVLGDSKLIKQEKKMDSLKKSVPIIYDFGTDKIELKAADLDLWRKIIRSVLTDKNKLISYGDVQGEDELRAALADYCFKARGVRASSENIIVGAGTGTLLSILCAILDNKTNVCIEKPGFVQAEQIFKDFGYTVVSCDTDNNGAKPAQLKKTNADLLIELPSTRSKISITALASRRKSLLKWAREKENRFIIEDDYNGELRYTARTVPAFQGASSEKIIYIGSFSKLLLPSVRIAYMVVPDSLMQKYNKIKNFYNQTSGKTEQLALSQYIISGALEKHLRRLRKIYYAKSRIICDALERNISGLVNLVLAETSLSVTFEVKTKFSAKQLCEIALEKGIVVLPNLDIAENPKVKLGFTAISEENIEEAIITLEKAWKNAGVY